MSTRTSARNTARPKAAKKPRPLFTDLDALDAESGFEPYPFTWKGRQWHLTHMQKIDAWAVITEDEDLTQNQQILELLEIALGDQWADFQAIPIPLHLMQDLFEDYNAYCGTSAGESGRSARS